jgi:hypothetical protein
MFPRVFIGGVYGANQAAKLSFCPPTEARKRQRGKITARLPRGKARVLLQRARENKRRGKSFAPRARVCAILRGKLADSAAARPI